MSAKFDSYFVFFFFFFRVLYWIVVVSITLDAIGEVSTSDRKSEVDILDLNALD